MLLQQLLNITHSYVDKIDLFLRVIIVFLKVYTKGVKWGITVSHSSIIRKTDELGKDFNFKIVKWKDELEHHRKMENSLLAIEKCLLSKLNDEAEGNTVESQKEIENTLEADITATTECCTAEAITLPTLQLDGAQKEEFRDVKEMEVLKVRVKKAMGSVFNETIYEEAVNFLQSCVNCPLVSEKMHLQTLKSYITNWKNISGPLTYQIIGDNVDMMIKIKHQASTKPNKSIHWFHLLGVKNRAIAYDLADDKPIGAVSDLQSGDILPSTKDNQDLLHDFVPLFARVVVDKVPSFKIFKDVVVRHIEHRYSDAMKQQSEQAST